MKKSVLCLLLVLFTALLPAASLAQEPARGFDTPEDCAQALFAALKAQDVAAMEACIAFDELAASFNFRLYAERINAVTSYGSYLPATDPYSIAYNASQLRRSWYLRVAACNMKAAGPLLSDSLFSGMAISGTTEEFGKILNAVDALDGYNAFAELTYLGIVAPAEIAGVAEFYATEKNRALMDKIMACWGIDTYTEFAIKVTPTADSPFALGAVFIIPLRFVQIGGRWLTDPNQSVVGSILGLSMTDFAVPLP
jgi:hypothetical protein